MRMFFLASAATLSLALCAPLVEAQTCGVRQPWAFDHFDGYFSRKLECTGEFIDDVWTRFALEQDEWQPYGVNEGGCNYNMPLGRTISALELLSFAGTDNPHCDWSDDLVLDWAFCFAGEAISELTPDCDEGNAAATTYYRVQLDYRTELHKRFFYGLDVPRRAATIFHEARHADGWCDHADGCPAGDDACDPTFENGCVGLASSDQKGTYGWTVVYLQRYLANVQPFLFDSMIADRVRADANGTLGRNFTVDPCFRVTGLNGSLEMGVDDFGIPLPGC